MKNDNDIQGLDSIIKEKQSSQHKKPPAYEWQELALRVIEELNIPKNKRNAVFKVCKEHPKKFIEKCLNDTKELCQKGDKWKYFFKLIGQF